MGLLRQHLTFGVAELLVAGVSYDQGQGVAKDEAKAVQWWQAAAAQGFAQAQFYLGTCVCVDSFRSACDRSLLLMQL
jgi:hypothetical protein